MNVNFGSVLHIYIILQIFVACTCLHELNKCGIKTFASFLPHGEGIGEAQLFFTERDRTDNSFSKYGPFSCSSRTLIRSKRPCGDSAWRRLLMVSFVESGL